MLQQRTSNGGVVLFASPLLEAAGVPHAFSTRVGGVSGGAFASLNLGNPGGCCVKDSETSIIENYRRLFEAAGLSGRQLCRIHQVHSAVVHVVGEVAAHNGAAEGDALITGNPSAAISMRTADCVPLLMATRDGRWAAAIHAGWRGVVAGVLPATIRRLVAASGHSPQDLLLAIGPCISGEAFEVGAEVTAEFQRAFGNEAPIVRTVGQKAYIDLRGGLMLQARREGIAAGQIDGCDLCTYRDAELFFSHRRDNGLTGRLAAVIAPR